MNQSPNASRTGGQNESLIDAAQLRTLIDEQGTLFSAGRARYRGDCRSIVGETKGPTTYGSYVVAVSAEYVESDDRTYVAFVHRPAVPRPKPETKDAR